MFLTVGPATWSIKKVAKFFNVIKYAARKAKSRVQENDLEFVYLTKKGKNLSLKKT